MISVYSGDIKINSHQTYATFLMAPTTGRSDKDIQWVWILWQPLCALHAQNSVHGFPISLHPHLVDVHALVKLLQLHFARSSSWGGAIIVPFGSKTGFSFDDPSTVIQPWSSYFNWGGSGSVQLCHMASCKWARPEFWSNASFVGGRVQRGGWSTRHLDIFRFHSSCRACVIVVQWRML